MLKYHMTYCRLRSLRRLLFDKHAALGFVHHRCNGAQVLDAPSHQNVWTSLVGRLYSTRHRNSMVRDKSRTIRANMLEVIYGGKEKIPEDALQGKEQIEGRAANSGDVDGEGKEFGSPQGADIKHRAFLQVRREYQGSSLELVKRLREDCHPDNEQKALFILESIAAGDTVDVRQSLTHVCALTDVERGKAVFSNPSVGKQLGKLLCRAMPEMDTETLIQSLLLFYWWEIPLSGSQNSVIEKECLLRMASWDMDTILLVADWWICKAGAVSWAFHEKMLSILRTSWTTLTSHQTVQAFYLCGQFKRPAQTVVEKLVLLAERLVDELSLTEIAAICNGLIKAAAWLPPNSILPAVVATALSHNCELQTDLDKFSVVTVMRFLGRSYYYERDFYAKLAKDLTPHIADLEPLALPHIASVFARAQVLHEQLFGEILGCFNHEKASLKDYFLVLWSFCRLNYRSSAFDQFVELAVSRIEAEERWTREAAFVFIKTLVPLSFVGRYPEKLLNRAFSPAYLRNYRGRCPPEVYKHLYCLDCSLAIECPDYKGHRLPKKLVEEAELVPHGSTKVAGNERKAYKEIISLLTSVLGGPDYLLVHPILDHIRTPVDIEVHLDGENQPINLRQNPPGSSSGPGSGPCTKLAVLVGPEDHYRRESRALLGVHVMKRRQLKMTGYQIVEIPFFEWHPIKSQRLQNKKNYLTQKIFSRVAVSDVGQDFANANVRTIIEDRR